MKLIVLLFIRLHYFLNLIGIRIHGLGKVQKFLKKEFVFFINGERFYYLPSIEGSYDYLLIGKYNEPETHILLSRILTFSETANFIDVGASVGEFVMDACRYSTVQNIYAFEPRPECASVIRKNAEINGDKRIIVRENSVSDEEGDLEFYLNPGGTSSGLYINQNSGGHKKLIVKTVTLDSALPETLKNPVILIDVEGAEPKVLRGGISFISRNKPVIIFEYNRDSRKHFSLEEIWDILGKDYIIYRLRGDGDLDKNFTDTWNCVAVPQNSLFQTILQGSIR